jgi:hypothetical protein
LRKDNLIAPFLWSARTSDCLQDEFVLSIDEARRVKVRAPRQWNNRYRWNFFILRRGRNSVKDLGHVQGIHFSRYAGLPRFRSLLTNASKACVLGKFGTIGSPRQREWPH